MELLRADELPREPGERVFRYSRLGAFVMLAVFTAPLAFPLWRREELAAWLARAGWLEWLLAGPFVGLGGLLWLLCLWACTQVARRSLSRANWLARVSPGGLVLNLRSFQNAHFPHDGPTVARLRWREVARVREARDSTPLDEGTRGRRRWVQVELAGVDTSELARTVSRETSRRGPERSFLGIRSSGRFQHVPVHVPEPGVLRFERLGPAMLLALGHHVPIGEALDVAPLRREPGREQEPGPRKQEGGLPESDEQEARERVRVLACRGERMAALRHARETLGLSLARARALVDEESRRAA